MSTVEITDDMIIACIRRSADGPIKTGLRTYHIAESLGASYRRPEIYRKLRRLEREGRVVRSKRYSAVNDIYWQLPHVG